MNQEKYKLFLREINSFYMSIKRRIAQMTIRKKISFSIAITFILCVSLFTFCENASNKKLKIASISTRNYGIIKPIDIYLIRDGYITNFSEKVEISALDKYFVQYYTETKRTTSSSPYGMNIPELKTDIVNWKYIYKDWKTVYFDKTLEYSHTIHIDLEEKESSYKITYYDILTLQNTSNDFFGHKREFCFNGTPKKELSKYKRIKEFPKSEIISITYIN